MKWCVEYCDNFDYAHIVCNGKRLTKRMAASTVIKIVDAHNKIVEILEQKK